MTDTSDKAIEALAAAPWAYASADLSAMILALQAERNQIAAEADARVEAAVLAAVEACAVFLETHEVGQDVLKGYVVSQRNELSGGTHPGEAYAAAVRSRGVTG